jgi:hypothetical protein
MAWFTKTYHCEACDETWEDEHCCDCNDKCPSCNAEIGSIDCKDAGYQGSCGDAGCPDCARPQNEAA